MNEILEYIANKLADEEINYAFMRWEKEIIYPYFVGTYNEKEPTEEDQFHEYSFTLAGFTRGSMLELLEAKETIENLFSSHVATLPNESAVVISYAGSTSIPIDEGELKRIEIELKIQEWRVN